MVLYEVAQGWAHFEEILLLPLLRLSTDSGSRHMKIHTRPSKCKQCLIGFTGTKGLNEHYWRHHAPWAAVNGIPNPRVWCRSCGTSLAKASSIKRHLKHSPRCHRLIGLTQKDQVTKTPPLVSSR
jgi:phage FluMu protein Com